jgi:DNA topoisomerase II
MHAKENVYVPELVFGHLLTGSNFDDSLAKVTGGRNGFGAKLTNIFSKRFRIDTVDVKRGFRLVLSSPPPVCSLLTCNLTIH